jgi:1-acyl-sn-glycerol-3-phosphate acyltransferase
MAKYKGEEYTLNWENRDGFARLAVEHEYPIVTAALVGGDDVYTSMVRRDSSLGRASRWVGRQLSGRTDVAMPLLRGIGPTLIPRPQRMYLAFGEPIDTSRPGRLSAEVWAAEVKSRVERDLEAALAELQDVRAADPYRQLNPLAWRAAATPASRS